MPSRFTPDDDVHGWHAPTPALHAGEVAMQERNGTREKVASYHPEICCHFMDEQHREFFGQLPFVVLGGTDAENEWPWATLLCGSEGFMTTPTSRLIRFTGVRNKGDPVLDAIRDSACMSMLGIELHTRRRNRMNGHVSAPPTATYFEMAVDQSYGNCPKYIQRRHYAFVRDPDEPCDVPTVSGGSVLDDQAVAFIRRTDTLFVASFVPTKEDRRVEGVDVNHRGGKPGFVRVRIDPETGATTLTVPDYFGNGMFNTLGNMTLNPKAGIVFPDFATGDLLFLTGRTEILHDGPEVEAFTGAERAWRLHVVKWVRQSGAMPLRWAFQDWSPYLKQTGTWEAAEQRLAQQHKLQPGGAANGWIPAVVSKIDVEAEGIKSFTIQAANSSDGAAQFPATWQPGQYVAVRLGARGRETNPTIAGAAAMEIRNYSISSAPPPPASTPATARSLRISVKREPKGLVSKALHDAVAVGDRIEIRKPSGDFVFEPSAVDGNGVARPPAVLLAAGIGATPIVAMALNAASHADAGKPVRDVSVILAARTAAAVPFVAELAQTKTTSGASMLKAVHLSRSAPDACEAVSEQWSGGHLAVRPTRLSMTALWSALGLSDDEEAPLREYFLCGPDEFVQSMYDGLREAQVPNRRIRSESFGPSTVVRDGMKKAVPLGEQATGPVRVSFTKSNIDAVWTPGAGSLLQLAESAGAAPAFGCRYGDCGTCAVRLLKGNVAYKHAAGTDIEELHVLPCCSVPARAVDHLVLDM